MKRKAEIKTKLEYVKDQLELMKKVNTHNIDEFQEMMRLEGTIVALEWILGGI